MNKEAKEDEWQLEDFELEKGKTKAGADGGNHHGGNHGRNTRYEPAPPSAPLNTVKTTWQRVAENYFQRKAQ
ncbi:unnamed protein product, partial [Leuciscus chuanchicus]